MFETTADFMSIVLRKLPLIDVRAPVEYEKGAFLNSINLPIMNNEERHLVGTCYKEKGSEDAVDLGYKLVSGSVKEHRVSAWKEFISKNPESLIYCFRGGQRSRISQQWIYESTGLSVVRLDGGYKAFRNYLIDALNPENILSSPLVLTGYTGSGKTNLLLNQQSAIDLEGLANHRGSSFGNRVSVQPTQINFENNLAYEIIRHASKNYKYMLLEDESRNIGRSYIPKELHEYFKSGSLILLKVDFDERLDNIFKEYVIQSQIEYQKSTSNDAGLDVWAKEIRNSLSKIKKRLGGEFYHKILSSFEKANELQKTVGETCLHKNWVEMLLKEYYDPMYKYQIEKKHEKIIFTGTKDEVTEYLKEKSQIYI